MAENYCIETGNSLPELVERVNKLVAIGYKPIGGFLLIDEADEVTAKAIKSGADIIPYRSVYHQAMFLERPISE